MQLFWLRSLIQVANKPTEVNRPNKHDRPNSPMEVNKHPCNALTEVNKPNKINSPTESQQTQQPNRSQQNPN